MFVHADLASFLPFPIPSHSEHENIITHTICNLFQFKGDEDNGSMSSTPTHSLHHTLPLQQEALNLEVNPRNSNNSNSVSEATARALEASRKVMEEALGVTPAKRFLSDEVPRTLFRLLRPLSLLRCMKIYLSARDRNNFIEPISPHRLCCLSRSDIWCTRHFPALTLK